MITREKYLKQISPFMDKPVIKVITGIRRCGKSTFLKQIIRELTERGVGSSNILLINKDSLEFDWLEDYRQLVEYVLGHFKDVKGKKYLFIDEIQEIEGWEKAVSGFFADNVADIYITGSNSRMLSSELATFISGRYVEFKLYTLTFSEFLEIRKKDDKAFYEDEFKLFLKFGGFPGIHHMEYDDEVIRQYVSSIYNTIILKDVVARNNIRDISLLEKISRFAADNCGNITSSKSIADYLKSQKVKGSFDTVQNYLAMLTSANIFHKVNRYDIKGKRQLEIHEKYYPGDIGLKNIMAAYKLADMPGQLESIVFLELLSRGYQVSVGKFMDQEVDFIAVKDGKPTYIQVSYLMADEKTVNREFGSLERINDNYPKLVLSMDKFFGTDRNGIRWFNLIEWLTGEKV